MRIDCQQCGAAYAIDDSLIGDRGVRAQCPRCGAQKVVKKPGPGELGPPPADPFGQPPPPPANPFDATQAPASASPFGAPPPGPFGAPPGAPANPFGAAPSPFGAPAAPPNPFGAPPGGGTPFPGTSPPAPANPFAPPPGAAAPPNPFAPAPPAASPFGAPPGGAPNPFAAAPAPGGNPFGAPPAGASPFGGGGPTPFGAPAAAPGGAPNPFGAPAAAPANPFGATSPPAPAAGGNPFGAPPAAGASPFGGPAAGGGNPFGGGSPAPGGGPFDAPAPHGGGGGDPFAAMEPRPAAVPAPAPFGGGAPAGGGAEDPFASVGKDEAPAAGGGGGGKDKDSREWRVKLADGTVLGPLTLDEVRQKVKSGEITKEAQAAQGGGNFRLITGFAPLAVVFRGPSEKAAVQKTVYRDQGGGGGGTWAILAAAILLLGGGGGVYVFRDKLFAPSSVEYENIFSRRSQMWKLQFPDLDGTSEQHLAKGLKLFREDTMLGYRMADEEFLKALCLDPENLEAIGAYVENYALLPPRRNDVESTKDALDGIEYAIKKNPRRARLHRSHGALLLKMGRVELAQAALAQALRLDPQDAASKLFMAQSNLERNIGESIKLTEEAVRADPELARATYILGLAYQKQGRFKTALNQFNSRLNKDREHRETLLSIARLYVEVGDFQKAVQHLERLLQVDAKNIAARLMLAKVLYQGLGDFRRAESQLAELVSLMGTEGTEMAREVYAHHAFVLGERGKWKEAEDAVNASLRDDPTYGPALYIAGRVLLHRGAAAEAREKLDKALHGVENTYLEAPVRAAMADVQRSQDQVEEARRSYAAVIRSDARYVRAYLGLASLYIDKNNMQQAAATMREVLDIDPFHRADHFYFTDYPETPRDVESYRPAWAKNKPAEQDRSIVLSSDGITAFHANQLDEAETLLRRAISDDRNNLAAQMYLGAVQLARKRAKDATQSLLLATRVAPNHVRTMYLLGRAYQSANDAEKADKKFQDVREADGNFVAVLNALGEMALQRGEDEKARDLFLDAFKADADFTPAKANLLRCNY
ncbi:MAG: zinc-ribbon domain-containing protein [Deltaproteobacteria bacterium]|nr:zinc-ribbon domain-containing protein [Deltaproteobacteria bacterium]